MADELTMREKLIELLAEGTPSPYCNVNNMDCSRCEYNHPKWHCADIRIADHLIAKGVTIQKWIPVTERLPEESGEYLAYCGEYDGVCVLYHEILKTKSKWRTNWKKVTHWMPLPEPPEGE